MLSNENKRLLELTTDVVTAFVSKNPVHQQHLPDVIKNVHATLTGLSGAVGQQQAQQEPAVTPSRSITPDYLICLEDGRKLKMLKRYLRNRYGLSPDDYREKWGLPADYPMVAPNYAATRSEFAKKIGLGKKPKS